jgi:hypothetical protein
MTHLTKLWIAVAAVAITALLTIAAGLLASLAMGVILGDHAKWRPLVISGSMIMGWMTPFVVVGIGAYRRASAGRHSRI